MSAKAGNRVRSRGARLVWLREQQKRSARSVALKVGMDPGLFSHLEKDKKASEPKLHQLAGVFGVLPAYLVGSFEQYLAAWVAARGALVPATPAGRLQALLEHACRMYGEADTLEHLSLGLALTPADLQDYLRGKISVVSGPLAHELERTLGLPTGWVLVGPHPEVAAAWLNVLSNLIHSGLTPEQASEAIARYLDQSQ